MFNTSTTIGLIGQASDDTSWWNWLQQAYTATTQCDRKPMERFLM